MGTYLLYRKNEFDETLIFDDLHRFFYKVDFNNNSSNIPIIPNRSYNDLLMSYICSMYGLRRHFKINDFIQEKKLWIEHNTSENIFEEIDLTNSIDDIMKTYWGKMSINISMNMLLLQDNDIKTIFKTSNGRKISYLYDGKIDKEYIKMFKIEEYDYVKILNGRKYITLIYNNVYNDLKLIFDNSTLIE